MNLIFVLALSILCGFSPVTSQNQGRECADINVLCRLWAQRGVCEKQRVFMGTECPVSCGICIPDIPAGVRNILNLQCGSFNHTVEPGHRDDHGSGHRDDHKEEPGHKDESFHTVVLFPDEIASGHRLKRAQPEIVGVSLRQSPLLQDDTRNNSAPLEAPKNISLQFICGASLISDHHLLTAAHCVTNEKHVPREITFREIPSGGDENSFVSVSYEVATVFVHPEYDPRSEIRYHDLAILETRNSVRFSPVTWPYCLPPPDTEVATKVLTVSGYGKVNSSHSSDTLQEADIVAVPNNVCAEDYRRADFGEALAVPYPQGLNDGLLCAGTVGKDACEGDSGGPLTYHDEDGREVLVGVVSVGLPCGDFPQIPGIYVNVLSHIDWINSIIYGF